MASCSEIICIHSSDMTPWGMTIHDIMVRTSCFFCSFSCLHWLLGKFQTPPQAGSLGKFPRDWSPEWGLGYQSLTSSHSSIYPGSKPPHPPKFQKHLLRFRAFSPIKFITVSTCCRQVYITFICINICFVWCWYSVVKLFSHLYFSHVYKLQVHIDKKGKEIKVVGRYFSNMKLFFFFILISCKKW